MSESDKPSHLDQEWFEMKNLRSRSFGTSAWIPLRAKELRINEGSFGYSGHKSEFFGCATAAFPVSDKEAACQISWRDLNLTSSNAPWFLDDRYHPADLFSPHLNGVEGIHLVLVPGGSADGQEWMPHQDLVLGLALIREGDVWVSPDEGFMEVLRLHKDDDGDCIRMEIRTSHLKDYLAARRMGLRLCSYQNREVHSGHKEGLSWGTEDEREEGPNSDWRGQVRESLEGGGFPGMTFAVFDISRTDLDPDDENPVMSPPSGENTKTEFRSGIRDGKRNFHIQGELYKNEWIEPGAHSPRVRMDSLPPTVYFTTDSEGKRQSRETLANSGRWLWFNPTVIRDLLDCRGSSLGWLGNEVGTIKCGNNGGVVFGINPLGLLTVFAKDIAFLPDWQQQLWAGHGVSPEGKLSPELFMIQVRGKPISSSSPEDNLRDGLQLIRKHSEEKFGTSILRDHPDFHAIVSNCHRFRATDESGLRSLAKDVARVTADSFDAALCTSLAPPPKNVTLKGNKSVENLMASRVGEANARVLLGPLIGIYDLRLADAHLPGSGVSAAMDLVGITSENTPIHQGHQLLTAAAKSLNGIAEIIHNW